MSGEQAIVQEADAEESIPAGYTELLGQLKERIRTAQVKAGLALNRELVLLYWGIGLDILNRQREEGWGARVTDRLAYDLKATFPEMSGFSPRNLKYMRAFAETGAEIAAPSSFRVYGSDSMTPVSIPSNSTGFERNPD